QRKHVVVPPGEDFIAGLDDKFMSLIVEPLAGMVGDGGCLLQRGVRADHLARHQIPADAEMRERALGLRTPQLVRRHLDDAETVGLFSHLGHGVSRKLEPRFGVALGSCMQWSRETHVMVCEAALAVVSRCNSWSRPRA